MSIDRSGYGFKIPQHQTNTPLNQAAPVQNTWYTILDTTTNVIVYEACVQVDTTGENLEWRATIDGETVSGGISPALADTVYFIYIILRSYDRFLNSNVTNLLMFAGYTPFWCRSFKLEVRKTSANGAGNLRGNILHGEW